MPYPHTGWLYGAILDLRQDDVIFHDASWLASPKIHTGGWTVSIVQCRDGQPASIEFCGLLGYFLLPTDLCFVNLDPIIMIH